MQAELADEQDSGDSAEPAGSGVLAEPSALGFVELWPWAQSLAFWDLVYKNLLLADKAQVVAVLSPSAHPGPWVAARRLAADVFVSTRRHSAHAHRHGLQLGEAMRRADLTPAAGPAPAAAQLARGGISATVVGEQVVEAYDIAPGPSWRDGLNLAVAGDVFAKSTARLVDEQLDSLGLALSAAEGAGGAGRALEAARLLRDGTAIPASALFFDDEVALEAWLALPRNAGFRSRIVDIPGVLKEGVERLVRAVLVGAVQHIGSHSGVRKLPNAKFTFIPAKGFNEGALELVICTRRFRGKPGGRPHSGLWLSGPGGARRSGRGGGRAGWATRVRAGQAGALARAGGSAGSVEGSGVRSKRPREAPRVSAGARARLGDPKCAPWRPPRGQTCARVALWLGEALR